MSIFSKTLDKMPHFQYTYTKAPVMSDGSIQGHLDKSVCFTETDHLWHSVKVRQHETITYIVNLMF